MIPDFFFNLFIYLYFDFDLILYIFFSSLLLLLLLFWWVLEKLKIQSMF